MSPKCIVGGLALTTLTIVYKNLSVRDRLSSFAVLACVRKTPHVAFR